MNLSEEERENLFGGREMKLDKGFGDFSLTREQKSIIWKTSLCLVVEPETCSSLFSFAFCFLFFSFR